MRRANASILIVDDDAGLLGMMELTLAENYQVVTCSNAEQMRDWFGRRTFSVVLCGVALPGSDGESLLSAIQIGWPGTEVVMIANENERQIAVRCMRLGAYGYLVKPWDPEELRVVTARAVEKSNLVLENAVYRQMAQPFATTVIRGSSQPIQDLHEVIARVSANDTPVLIHGESGTGKALVAQSIHAQSPRKRGNYVVVDCSAGPPDLLESELFGRERDASGSAQSARIGKIEYANGGTLFLNGVAELQPNIQEKLLRVLREREIIRFGAKRGISVDVRVIASSSEDLGDLTRRKQFNMELYHRLKDVLIQVPPLRDRGDDVVELCHTFLAEIALRYRKSVPRLSEGLVKALRTHPFLGNVRELKHLVEILIVSSDEESIDVSALPVQMLLRDKNRPWERLSMKDGIREFRSQAIRNALLSANGNKSHAAAMLGIHRNTMQVLMAEIGLPTKRYMERKKAPKKIHGTDQSEASVVERSTPHLGADSTRNNALGFSNEEPQPRKRRGRPRKVMQ